MKYSLFIYLIFNIGVLFAQKNISFDSLGKYSYPIFVIENNHQHTGTAFFYLSNDTTFLVSNYHAIKGMNPLSKKIEYISDTLYLKYKIKNSLQYKILPIDISEERVGKTDIFSIIDKVDLLKIPFIAPANGEIYYINDYIDAKFFDKTPDSIFIFGHPSPPGNIQIFYSSQKIFKGIYNKKGYSEYDSAVVSNFPKLPQYDRTILSNSKKDYFFGKPVGEHGFSGAPVFGKFTKKNKTIYKFMGVIFSEEPHSKQSWIIRGDRAYKYLKTGL